MDLSRAEQDPSKYRPIASEIDRIAKEDPGRTWAIIPKNWQNLEDGFEGVTFFQFAEAIDRAAWCNRRYLQTRDHVLIVQVYTR